MSRDSQELTTQTMTGKSLPMMATPLRARRPDIDEYNEDDEEEEEKLNQIVSTSRQREFQIVKLSPSFKVPDGWLVQEKPRPYNPAIIDKYYYEPGTGRKFRSLISVQRYLTEETRGFHTTDSMISENENTTYIEPGTGQKFRSLRAVERYLTGENACIATPKQLVKSGTGKQSAPGGKGCLKAEDDKVPLKAFKLPVQSRHSKKSGSRKKIHSGKDNKASVHNFSQPPAKVNWVLSGPGGFWSPYVDESIVPESEKLKWSEAFVLSINDGDINGLNC